MMSQLAELPSNIALFGGAFDPPTIAHELIGQVVYDKTGMSVLYMPCWSHTFGKHPSEAFHRLQMISIKSKKNPFMISWSWEIDNKHNGSMYETLKFLNTLYPKTKFHIVIGMDNANVIFDWDRGNLLIQENPFIVFKRNGYESKVDWFTKSPHLSINSENIIISSTDVRNAIKNKNYDLAKSLVSEEVWSYIVVNRLYDYQG